MQDAYEQQLLHQIEKTEKELQKAIGQSKSLKKNLEVIAEKVCNFKYAERQLGGPNQIFAMSGNELRDFIIDNIMQQKQAFIQSIKELQELYLQESQAKEDLAKKIIELTNQLEEEKKKRIVLPSVDAPQVPIENSSNDIISVHEDFQNDSNVNSKDIVIVGDNVYDVQKEMTKIDIYQEEIIKVIGKFGYSESKQIFEEVMRNIDIKETTLKTKIAGLAELLILDTDKINTFLRKNLILYALTPLGEEIYKTLTNSNPVKAEKNKLRTQHSTLAHAYAIKDTAKMLQDLGYTNISIDSSANQIQVAGSSRYVPDIIADFNANKKTYWEVELAHHMDGDFFEKLQKAAKVTDTLYIIAPDKTCFDKLKNQIGRYKATVLSKGISTKLTIFLGTMNHLRKREIFSNKDCKIEIG